jgi:predicted molibdopterin-dependent oxidoreductase YjgC
MAAVALPGAGLAEKDVAFTSHRAPGAARAQGRGGSGDNTRPDWEFLEELGRRLGLDWKDKEPRRVQRERRGRVPPYYAGIS